MMDWWKEIQQERPSLPEEVINKEKGFIMAQIKEDPKNAKKPENIIEKMVDGKISKFYEQNCLLQQAFVKDDSVTGREIS